MSGSVNLSPSSRGLLRLVSPSELVAAEATRAAQALASREEAQSVQGIAAYVRTRLDAFKRHRQSANGWDQRLLAAMQTFKGEYDPQRLAQIREFGGSEIYARVTAVKCRGATSLLRDVYLGPQRAWEVAATPDPVVPDDVRGAAVELLATEIVSMTMAGQQPDEGQVSRRLTQLLEAAKDAAVKEADKAAERATTKLDDVLVEGNFYEALAEFLVDLPLFPFAVIKGPVVQVVPDLAWSNGKPQKVNKARMFWRRVSPFDLWFTPGVSDVANAEFIELVRFSRSEINALLGLPGYSDDALRAVLDEYGRGGLHDWVGSGTESERARHESKESPLQNSSGLIDCLEWHGPIQGRVLLESGIGQEFVEDPLRDYYVQAWIIGRHVIKCQLTPSPRQRPPYYISSFEKVPGTIVGNGLPDILADVQDVCNAALRALCNNMGMASGPQVVINYDRLHSTENPQEIYPWKRWAMISDPLGGSHSNDKPIEFFQPSDNSQSLLMIYREFTQIADELSAIPRYITGSGATGGAGRTASGLAMLMGNASKILQTVCANIDRDVMNPLLTELFDMVMLTDDTGLLRGDEGIEVKGVAVAVQRETERQRQLEFLQITANPIDMGIIGPEGRAEVLRSVSKTIGLEGESIVPSNEQIKIRTQMAQQMQMLQAVSGGAPGGAKATGGGVGSLPKGDGDPAPGDGASQGGTPAAPRAIQGPRTNLAPSASSGGQAA